MTERAYCEMCGRLYSPASPGATPCQCATCAAPPPRLAPIPLDSIPDSGSSLRQCRKCGREFWSIGHEHVCCTCKAERRLAKHAKKVKNSARQWTFTCKRCGKQFVARTPNAIVCASCRPAKIREDQARKRERYRQARNSAK